MKKWRDLTTKITKSVFWDLAPTNDPLFKDGWMEVSTDGALWILEANFEHRYHLVCRNSPENAEFRRLCLFIVQLSGLRLKPSAIY